MNPRRPRPPRSAERLLALLLPWQYRDEHLGDLEEGFLRRTRAGGSASRWYWRQVVRSIPAAVALRYQTRNDDRTEPGLSMETLSQDLRYGLRALWKNPGFAVVSTLRGRTAGPGVTAVAWRQSDLPQRSDLPHEQRKHRANQSVSAPRPSSQLTRTV